MDEETEESPCQECGVVTAEWRRLRDGEEESAAHAVALEARLATSAARAAQLQEQADTWRDKYERLYDSHKRVQKLNQVLEDKLLQLVERMKGEKAQLTRDIATLSVRLAHSKHTIAQLHKENERYKNDMNLAIQLLQCKPDNFVSHKLDNLPVDTQMRVSQFVMSKSKSGSPNLPANNSSEPEVADSTEYEFNVSASLMAKILEESLLDTVAKHCDTCSCSETQGNLFSYDEKHYSVATQTLLYGEMKNSLCLNCNGDVQSLKSNISNRSVSPLVPRILNNDERVLHSASPLRLQQYSVSQSVQHRLHNAPQLDGQLEKEEGLNMSPQDGINSSTVLEKASPKRIDPQISMNGLQNGIQPDLLPHDLIQSTVVQERAELNELPVNSFLPSDLPSHGIQPNILHSNSVPLQPNLPEKIVKENDLLNDKIKSADKLKLATAVQMEIVKKIGEDLNQMKNNFSMEPATHHRLCDRTKSLGSNVSDVNVLNDDYQLQERADIKDINKESIVERKNSICSASAISRTSSVAKSTASTHRSNTHVGPGPRFCSLRMQAGSKNILLDNAQPDVPPVLYTRQSRCTDNILRADDDLVLDEERRDDNANVEVKVVESTLIDVHTDGQQDNDIDSSNLNPVLMNVSASPLQPLKAPIYHPLENINNNATLLQNNILDSFDLVETLNDKKTDTTKQNGLNDYDNPTNTHGMKIFNFDLYEQNMLPNQFTRPFRKIDMSQLHSIENTRISKDLPPLGMGELDLSDPSVQVKIPSVNVNPNSSQIKMSDVKKVVAEQSTSSLSSDDSAALLQKQQLIRVAEWVQQNLEQQNNLSPSAPGCGDTAYAAKRRDSQNGPLGIVHKMPHPVTKYSHENACVTGVAGANMQILTNTVVKETVFPVEFDALPLTTDEDVSVKQKELEKVHQRLERKVSAEELARMEYNVKKFLLSGPQWSPPPAVPPAAAPRVRHTSSKTETDL